MATTTQPRPGPGSLGPTKLRNLREAAGLTQIETAQLCNVSLAFIRNVEQGHVPKKSPTLERIIELLNDAGRADNSAGSRIGEDATDNGQV